MECKKCGAELPYNAFGDIKCQFCNAQNHVPIPKVLGDTKEPVKAEVEVQKSVEEITPEPPIKPIPPVLEKEISKKGGFPKGVLIVLILIIGGVSAYVLLGANSGSSSRVSSYSTPKPTYSTPTPTSAYRTATISPPITTPTPTTKPPEKSFIVVDLLPDKIGEYKTNYKYFTGDTSLMASIGHNLEAVYVKKSCKNNYAWAIYDNSIKLETGGTSSSVLGTVSVFECDSVEDAKGGFVIETLTNNYD